MQIDFNNTKIAFERYSNRRLQKMRWLFRAMSQDWLVGLGSHFGLKALNWGLPVEGLIHSTIFDLFCGGRNLPETLKAVRELKVYGVETVLDYGAEAKDTEADFDTALDEFLKTLAFAADKESLEIISAKVTGLAQHALLEKITAGDILSEAEQAAWNRAKERLRVLCQSAQEKKMALFIDAEESWIQDAIDQLTDEMMAEFNQERVVVYNTFQLYRHDRLQFLKDSYEKALEGGYLLGAKMVRGAYMEKERDRAKKMGYPSPIQPNKEATDRDYNLAVLFCVEHYERIASSVATHNQFSTAYQVELMEQEELPKRHPHLSFCQLYGMSDQLTFNLAKAGYRVSKYMPFGPIKDVIPYLIRRAQENSSVNGEMSRELQLIEQELKRRKTEGY
ncbi:proline dehydrogenase [Saprospira grandis DSM 2844]|uniref:Proline dehydrogenase n=1 Tax=Saprospira grandis DSM 2844 TaxID=694433 RepID=J0P0K5_9BACT|nr:proline dehydrogenase family protein [Saprospira grandis]EJF53314.1 proline dehydrogenase [Saprospira grandis DSM 2844]